MWTILGYFQERNNSSLFSSTFCHMSKKLIEKWWHASVRIQFMWLSIDTYIHMSMFVGLYVYVNMNVCLYCYMSIPTYPHVNVCLYFYMSIPTYPHVHVCESTNACPSFYMSISTYLTMYISVLTCLYWSKEKLLLRCKEPIKYFSFLNENNEVVRLLPQFGWHSIVVWHMHQMRRIGKNAKLPCLACTSTQIFYINFM